MKSFEHTYRGEPLSPPDESAVQTQQAGALAEPVEDPSAVGVFPVEFPAESSDDNSGDDDYIPYRRDSRKRSHRFVYSSAKLPLKLYRINTGEPFY